MWRVRSVVATLAVLIVFVPSTASQAVTPGFNGRIGYVYNREIHTRNTAGTGDRILTTVGPKRRINEIAWSPDGSQLAFTNDIALAGTAWGRINIINADGTGRHVAVPTSALPGRHPNVYGVDWSPGGRRLAIYANHGIMIARVDGSNVHKISGSHYDIDPSWSPDGRHLVVAEVIRADRTRLVVMRPDGTHRRTIVEHGLNLQPSWSPDGSTIVYSHGTDADAYPLYLFSVRPDGSHRRSFTEPTDLWQESPTWSPDGSALLLVMRDHIWMMSADGTLGIRVTRPPHLGWAPAWQPVPASP
jgi:Tol biopolymer transport system component